MFGLGIWEISIVLVVALLVLGPKRLPDAARSLGRSLAEFRRASNEIRNALVLEGSVQPGPPMGQPPSKEPVESLPTASEGAASEGDPTAMVDGLPSPESRATSESLAAESGARESHPSDAPEASKGPETGAPHTSSSATVSSERAPASRSSDPSGPTPTDS